MSHARLDVSSALSYHGTLIAPHEVPACRAPPPIPTMASQAAAAAPSPAPSAASSSSGDGDREPSLADWRMSETDRRLMDAPLNLRPYTPHMQLDLGVSSLRHPSAVRGMHRDPRLTAFVELMCHDRDMRERLFKSTWYETDFLKIREDRMFIRELALCSMDVVKTVLSYFPTMRVCACSVYFEEHTIAYLRPQLQLLVHGCAPQNLTLVRKRPDGRQWVAPYPPADPSTGIRWQPMDTVGLA